MERVEKHIASIAPLRDPLAEWLQTSQTIAKQRVNETSTVREHLLDHEAGFMTLLYTLCSEQLQQLGKAVEGRKWARARREGRMRDTRAKFSLFGDCIEGGKLESCLSTDDDLRNGVLTLLFDIGKLLSIDLFRLHLDNVKGLSELAQQPTTSQLRTVVAQAKQVLEAESSDTDATVVSSSEDGVKSDTQDSNKTLVKAVLRPMSTSVDLLLSLTPTLEQTYRNKHRSTRKPKKHQPGIAVTTAALHYVHYVASKFPLADNLLVERLGEASWQRHERLRAIERNEPLGEALPLPAKSVFRPVSIFKDSALGSSLPAESERAPSQASHSSFVSCEGDHEKGHFKVPKLPADASYGQPFTCPYCEKLTSSINCHVDWKMHVFADLQAYICTSSSCPEMLKTFPSRKSWFEHETTYHMTLQQLNCQLCAAVYHDEKSFLDHAVSVHDILFNSAGTKVALLSTATVSVLAPAESLKCPLCSETGFSRHRQYATHLGKHLESISLASLPQYALSDEEDALSSSEAAMTEQSSTHLTRRGNWLPEEDIALAQLVSSISSSGPINWVRIAHNMQHRTPKQCRERYHQHLNPGLNREPITVEEELIKQRWTEIAQKLGNCCETTKQSPPGTSSMDNFSDQKDGLSAELSQTSSLELSGMPTSQAKLRDVFPDLQPEYHEQPKEVETIQANRRNLVADRLQAAQQDRLPSNTLSSNRREKSPFKQNSPLNPSRPEKVLQTPALQKSSTLISSRELMLDEGDLNEVNTPGSSKLMSPSDSMLSEQGIEVPEVPLFGDTTKRADQVHSGGQTPAQTQAAYQAALVASQKNQMVQAVNQQGMQQGLPPQQHAAQLQHQASMQQQQLAQNQGQNHQLPNGTSPQHRQLQRAQQMHDSLMAGNHVYAQQYRQRFQQLFKQHMGPLMQQVGGDQSRIPPQQIENLKRHVNHRAMFEVQELMRRQQQARAQMGAGGPVGGAPKPGDDAADASTATSA